MAQSIDFSRLLTDLFQEKVPIEEKVQECLNPKKNGADFSKALGEIFQTEKKSDIATSVSSTCAGKNEADISPLQACSLYVFMRKIVMEHFGMGYDYAVSNREGIPLKSWFTVHEVIEAAKSQGYRLTVTEARAYLDELIKQRYIETDDYKYRRCAIWDKQLENYLLRYRL